MPLTPGVLVALGAFATLCSAALLVDFDDPYTNSLLGVIGSVAWAFFGVSAFDVLLPQHSAGATLVAMRPVAFLGIGMAVASFLFAAYQLVTGLGSDAASGDTDPDGSVA